MYPMIDSSVHDDYIFSEQASDMRVKNHEQAHSSINIRVNCDDAKQTPGEPARGGGQTTGRS